MKAQILSLDLMVAVVIVVSLMGALGVLLYQYTIYDRQQSELRDLELRSEPALNVLMSTKGNPENWNSTLLCSEINSLGLTSESSIISMYKLLYFVALDYNCSKTLLGLSGYDFYFEARNETGDLVNYLNVNITAGILPPEGSEAIFSTRKALTDTDALIDITLGVWYE